MCGGSVCVAVKNDGTAEAWGDSDYGGDASGVDLTNVKSAMCGRYTRHFLFQSGKFMLRA